MLTEGPNGKRTHLAGPFKDLRTDWAMICSEYMPSFLMHSTSYLHSS